MRTQKNNYWHRRRVLLVGLGLHGGGVATAKWLVRQGANLRISDAKTKEELASSIRQLPPRTKVHVGVLQREQVLWAQTVVINPGVDSSGELFRLAKKRGIDLHNEATIFFTNFRGPIIGVTGTRGKTTSSLLIGHFLKAAGRSNHVIGNVRDRVMLEYLPRQLKNDIAVIELSSFQLELLPEVCRSPHVALMTNLYVDHLNRYGSQATYAAAKFNMFRWQTTADIAVLNADNRWCRKAAKITSARICWFSRQGPVGLWSIYARQGWIWERRDGVTRRLVPIRAFSLSGTHQTMNLLGAIAVARAFAITPSVLLRAMKNFPGVAHRQEVIRTWRGHQFINDTAATSPEATLAAVENYPWAVMIVGGTDKHLDFSVLAKQLVVYRGSLVFLPGTGTDKLQAEIRKLKKRIIFQTANSMREAVTQAINQAKPKQSIILSPGAASFGLFRHEFHRGEEFRNLVTALP